MISLEEVVSCLVLMVRLHVALLAELLAEVALDVLGCVDLPLDARVAVHEGKVLLEKREVLGLLAHEAVLSALV